MNIDIFFPPPPLHNQKPLPCSDLAPARLRALDRLSGFATFAESKVGSIPAPSADSPPLAYEATSRGFALHCLGASPYVSEVAELLGRSKLSIAAGDQVDVPHVMLIDVRKYWGVLGPIRGDVVLFADGQAAVVTKSLCIGCLHFEAISLAVETAPQIVKRVHWTSTLKWIIRLVDESELPALPSEPAAEPATTPAPVTEAPAEEVFRQEFAVTPPTTEPETGRRGKRTGIR